MGLKNLLSKGYRVENRERREKHKQTVTLEPPADFGVPMYESQPNPLELDNSSAFSAQSNQFNQYLGGQTIGNRNILVITPSTNQDVSRIVENLQNNEACVIDLEKVPLADAQRRLDFLSGVICALNGNIKPLDAHKYILTPQGLGVVR